MITYLSLAAIPVTILLAEIWSDLKIACELIWDKKKTKGEIVYLARAWGKKRLGFTIVKGLLPLSPVASTSMLVHLVLWGQMEEYWVLFISFPIKSALGYVENDQDI